MKPFETPIRPEDVRELIDFGLPEEQYENRYASMATLQSEGVAALYDILCHLDFAYLADEVGMGKTYQALGVAAALWNLKPDARVVFVSPRANLQTKWIRDYTNFIVNNYRKPQGGTGDAMLRCVLRGEPLVKPEFCGNLREFAASLAMPGRRVWFLRHTSFQRPLNVSVRSEADVKACWGECRAQMNACGLWEHQTHAPCRAPEKASGEFNRAFGEALNQRLQKLDEDGDPAIDLLVMDEAQCLRNSGNQGNSVLRAALEGNVGKWLFLSATPVHTGRRDVQTQVNEYVAPDFISDQEVDDPEALRRKMQKFLVRRPRKFVIDPERKVEWVKHQYRDHLKKPARSEDPVAAMAMALVQKKMVPLLEGRNNRFRIGFLSSFESLQESIQRRHGAEEEGGESETDFYLSKNDAPRDERDRKPLDWNFVTELDRRFKKAFGENEHLPHPKLDHTVDLIADAAFDGNQKYLVFCRRIRAVEELRRRLDYRWHRWIESRIRECWRSSLDWRSPPRDLADSEPAEVEAFETLDGLPEDAGFRNASRKGEWLYKYRMTFRDAGRNALVFQENWLATVCGITGRDLDRVVAAIPPAIIEEGLAATTREYSGRQRIYPADLMAHVSSAVIQREPGLVGLEGDAALTWARFLATIHPLKNNSSSADDVVSGKPAGSGYTDVLLNRGFWEHWRERFCDPDHPLHLGTGRAESLDALFRREIIKNLIGQTYRLTDAILDLYFAELHSGDDRTQFLHRFFNYLAGDTKYAQVLRERTAGWIEHFPLIMLNCFRPERDRFDLGSMAAKGWFPELNNQTAVVGITGGSAINETAIRQFKTPFYPQIIVCTDVLKEGEDLHTFCDQVVHYGVAWTSGDLEQRIGRVDRYFSQIERRLCHSETPESVKLGIFYPYLDDTLEKWQIERVHSRVRDAEKILDDFAFGSTVESKELRLDDLHIRSEIIQCGAAAPHPFADIARHLPARGMNIVRQSRKEAEGLKHAIREGGRLIGDHARSIGIDLQGDPSADLVFSLRLPRNGDLVRFRVEWHFVHDLLLRDHGVYALRFLEPVDEQQIWGDEFSFAYERRERKPGYEYYRTQKVLLPTAPTPEEILDSFFRAVEYFEEDRVSPETELPRLRAVTELINGIPTLIKGKWVKPHKAEVTFRFAHTKQKANIYIYRNMLLVVSLVSRVEEIDEDLLHRTGWGLREWCLDQNRQLTLGFLHVKDGEDLNFCERIFLNDLPKTDLGQVINSVAMRADMYEAFLTGQDVN